MSEPFDLSVLKRHAFRLTFNSTAVGPLESEPKIEIRSRRYDCNIYENGGSAVASYIEQLEAVVEVTTKNVGAALEIVKNFRKGDDVLNSASRHALTFTPIVASGVTEKTLTFTDAAVVPEAGYIPSSTEDHTAKLVFRCVPNASTGALFTYA